MDLFSTGALTKTLASLKRPERFLLDTFYPQVVVEQSEEIHFDVMRATRRVSPFVSPLIAGKLVEKQGFEVKTFKPAYIKDKRILDLESPLKRSAGEKIAGGMNPGTRVAACVARELSDQADMLTRRLEIMGAEVLLTGKSTIAGEGFHTQSIDFGRDASLTKVLTADDRWGEASTSPIKDLENWSLELQKLEGATADIVVMDPSAWQVFRDSTDVVTVLDTRRADTDAELARVIGAKNGAKYQGTDGSRSYFTYGGWYIDPADNIEKPILPENTVILSGSDFEGVRHFGAVKDHSLNFQAGEFVPKSWVSDDPSLRYLMVQSAPLIVPGRPNASMAITVR